MVHIKGVHTRTNATDMSAEATRILACVPCFTSTYYGWCSLCVQTDTQASNTAYDVSPGAQVLPHALLPCCGSPHRRGENGEIEA